MDGVDKVSLVIGLQVIEHEAGGRRLRLGHGAQILQRGDAIDVGLALTQEVEVGSREQEDYGSRPGGAHQSRR
jgi:hypothetical protein